VNSLDVIETLARLIVDQCERTARLLLQLGLPEEDKLKLRAGIRYELDSLDLVLRSAERMMLGELGQVMASFSLMQKSEGELLQMDKSTNRVESRFVFAAQLSGLEAEVTETRERIADKIAELRQLVSNERQLLLGM